MKNVFQCSRFVKKISSDMHNYNWTCNCAVTKNTDVICIYDCFDISHT